MARYLKKVVLPALVRSKLAEKVHIKRTLSAEEMEHNLKSMSKVRRARGDQLSSTVDNWLWKAAEESPQAAIMEDNSGKSGEKVHMGRIWDQLNDRRARVREEKVEREGKWVQKLQRAKEEGKLDAT